jgi:hypothetical protein
VVAEEGLVIQEFGAFAYHAHQHHRRGSDDWRGHRGDPEIASGFIGIV